MSHPAHPLLLRPAARPARSAPRPSPASADGHLDRSAITLKAHAAVRSMILTTGRSMTHGREYAQHLGRALRVAWNTAYEAAARAGEIDPSVVEKRLGRQKAAERKRIANSPLNRALQAIAACHVASTKAAA